RRASFSRTLPELTYFAPPRKKSVAAAMASVTPAPMTTPVLRSTLGKSPPEEGTLGAATGEAEGCAPGSWASAAGASVMDRIATTSQAWRMGLLVVLAGN